MPNRCGSYKGWSSYRHPAIVKTGDSVSRTPFGGIHGYRQIGASRMAQFAPKPVRRYPGQDAEHRRSSICTTTNTSATRLRAHAFPLSSAHPARPPGRPGASPLRAPERASLVRAPGPQTGAPGAPDPAAHHRPVAMRRKIREVRGARS